MKRKNWIFACCFDVTFVTIQCVKPRISSLHYPVVIKQHLDFIVLSVPDLGISVVENAPLQGKLNPEYVLKIATALANVWLKVRKDFWNISPLGKVLPPRLSRKCQLMGENSIYDSL
ncbi:MAG: hypothetical protein IPJ71_17865 [Bdellovibrionales bacterium]|nr:hypothetical protein [Bdellovibrionales bacterium]